MKYYLTILITSFIVSFTQAQSIYPAVTAKQAKKAMKTEQKKEKEERRKTEIARKDEEDNIETSPRYKETTHVKTPLFKKRKVKKAQPAKPSESTTGVPE